MATLLARYLINEGSGSTIADSSGNGNDLTLTATGNGGWEPSTSPTGMGNGTSIRSDSIGSNSIIARNDDVPLLLAGLAEVTVVTATEYIRGSTSYHRLWIMGLDSSNGIIGATLGGTDTMEGRWNYESGLAADPVRYRWYPDDWAPVGSMSDNQVLIMEFDGLAASGSRQTLWSDNVLLTSVIDTGGTADPLPADMSSYIFSLLNRPDLTRAIQGNIGYFEIWSGKLTAQERADATAALLLDCDTAWGSGPPPAPGDPSFCWSPDNGTTTPWQTLAGTGYQQLLQTHSAVASMDAAFVAENTNQSFCFDWAQLETGRIATSCIETTGATGTRVRSRVVGDPMSKYTQQEMRQDWAMQIKFSLEMDLADTDPTGSGIWLLTDGTVGDLAYGVMTSAGLAFRVMVGGVYHDVQFLQASVQAIKRHEEIDLRCKWTSTEVVAWLSFPGQAQLKATNVVSLAQWPLRDLEIWLLQLEVAGPSASDTPGVVKSFRWECPAPIDTEIEAWT